MALEIVKLRVLQDRSGDGYTTVDRPVVYVNSQVRFCEENGDQTKSLTRWLNQTIMRWPSEQTRGELFVSALNDIYGEDWSVLVADPMSMIRKNGQSLDYHKAVAQIGRLGFPPQDY